MNQTQINRERFPGIEVNDDLMLARRSRSFSCYQKEKTIIECMKDTLSDMDMWECQCVVVKDGEHWWDMHRFYNRDAIVSVLFDFSLAKYITKFEIVRKVNDKFDICVKVHDLTNDLNTNIGPDLIEFVGSFLK